MTTTSWYRRSVWNYKGNKEYTKSGYDLAKERFNLDDLDVDCSDRHYVITGSNSGIGLEIMKEVAKRGGVLHMVCRNYEAAKTTRSDIITNTGNDKIHIHTLDLSKPREVMKWAQDFASTHENIHVLVNNAGCMIHERKLDEDGIEYNFAVNTLSVHIITMYLLPVLQRNEDARVITVSSAGMLTVRLDPIDLMHEDMQPFDGRLVYSQNKRQQVVMTLWYAQRFDKVHFSVMHPGWADTPAVRTALPAFYELMKDNLRTPSEGADTAVWLAISKASLKHPSGLFFQDREPVSTHLPLAWTKTSIEEENLFMQKLMLLMQKISNEISPEPMDANGDIKSEVNTHVANGVKAPLEMNGTSTNNVEEITTSLKKVSLQPDDGNLKVNGEVTDDQNEKQSTVPVADTNSEGSNQNAGEPSDESEKLKITSLEKEKISSPHSEDSAGKAHGDSSEVAGVEKVEEDSPENSDNTSLRSEKAEAQIDESEEKSASPSPVIDQTKNSDDDTPTLDKTEVPESEIATSKATEEPEFETTTDEKEQPESEITPDENEEPESEALPDKNEEPKPPTAKPGKNEEPELETPVLTESDKQKVQESEDPIKDSKPETPQSEEKEESGTEDSEELPHSNEEEKQESSSGPISSEPKVGTDANSAAATTTISPTPTDQTHMSATSVVEHLIDVTAARAGDSQYS